MKRLRLIVRPDEHGQPLEALVTGRGELKPEQFQEVLSAGGITVDRRRATRPDLPLVPRQEVVVHLAARGEAARGPRALDAGRVVHLDADLLVVDKPPFLAAQATQVDLAAGLDAAVRALISSRGEKAPFVGLVHRLDLETSGLTVFARTPAALAHLTAQFREGTIEKRYELLVTGIPAWEEREVDAPIAAAGRLGSYEVSPRGRPARTHFRVVERIRVGGREVARLEARPKTGRTHQIRVHAAHLGHPLLGDRRYGGPAVLTTAAGGRIEVPRVCLHAAAITFDHPRGGRRTFDAPWPADLAACEAALRAATGSPAARRRPGGPPEPL